MRHILWLLCKINARNSSKSWNSHWSIQILTRFFIIIMAHKRIFTEYKRVLPMLCPSCERERSEYVFGFYKLILRYFWKWKEKKSNYNEPNNLNNAKCSESYKDLRFSYWTIWWYEALLYMRVPFKMQNRA